MEIDPFIFRLSIFILSIFIGYYVVWSVTPSLHTPLMSGANAISGITILGALAIAGAGSNPQLATILGVLAVVFATTNVVGGYLVTDRMLEMFKKKAEKKNG